MIHRLREVTLSPVLLGFAGAGLLGVIVALFWESQWMAADGVPEVLAGKVVMNPGGNGTKPLSMSTRLSMESPRGKSVDQNTGFTPLGNFSSNGNSGNGVDRDEGGAALNRRAESQNAGGGSVRMTATIPRNGTVVGGTYVLMDTLPHGNQPQGYPGSDQISSGSSSVAAPGVPLTDPSSPSLSPYLPSAQESVGGGGGEVIQSAAPDSGSSDRLTPASSVDNSTTSTDSESVQAVGVQNGQQSSPGVESVASGDPVMMQPTPDELYRGQYGWAVYGEMIRQRRINQANGQQSQNAGADINASLPASTEQ